jgi:ribonucleotide reductase beta subunit family protein with ferritin-like domain
MPGLGQANEFIARDEGLHTDFAIALFRMFPIKPSRDVVVQIINDAVDIANDFIGEALPEGLPEMNSQLMLQYIWCVADKLIHDLGYEPIYKKQNPFTFMDQINMQNHTMFFENRSTSYKGGGSTNIAFNVDV